MIDWDKSSIGQNVSRDMDPTRKCAWEKKNKMSHMCSHFHYNKIHSLVIHDITFTCILTIVEFTIGDEYNFVLY